MRLTSLSLFWRNFLAFWAGMAAILAIGMALTAAVASYRFHALDGISAAGLTRDARQIAATEGQPGLERWLREMDSRFSALNVYLAGADNADILGRAMPRRVQDWVASLDRAALSDAAAMYPLELPLSWWDPQAILLPDGEDLVLVFLPFDSSRWEVLGLSPVAVALGLFALLVTAPLCWALTRHVTDPVRQLQHAARALAAGNLDSRTPAPLAQRADELGHLARDFDGMAAQLQALVASRERLLRNVAHELRSPLARLSVSLELARRQDDRQGLQMDRIEREAERLDALVAHTLALARLGATAVPLHPLDLAQLVDEVIEDARFEAAGRGIAIGWKRPGCVLVHGDEMRLGSAIENVVRNAIRHTETGTAVDIALRICQHEDGLRAEIDVTDSGPGVPPQTLPHLFEPFYRVREAASKEGSGSGLGLSIALASMKAHGGGMSVENAVPRGLCVRLWLPAIEDEAGGDAAGTA